jgi:hypothetical protein
MSRKSKPSSSLSITGATAAIANPFTPEDRTEAAQTLAAALKATKSVRTRDSSGRIAYRDVEDWTARMQAATVILAYSAGKPTSTAVVAHISGSARSDEGCDEALQRLLETPEAIRSARAVLDQMEGFLKKAAPVEIEATPPTEADDPSDGTTSEGPRG